MAVSCTEEGPAERGQAPGHKPLSMSLFQMVKTSVTLRPTNPSRLLFFQDHLAEYFLGS